ncbi:MAG: phosphopantothenoylcysteine decarboxylase [Endomicrobia bacterium]|nr:phosphopantothenoylcysteine decarboxylase [Endomicrobiia bacterium]
MRKKYILVTAGPTREYIDPVRFISNLSSGKVGYHIAKVFSKKYKVILISGPTYLKPPKNVKTYYVETSDEMSKLVKKFFKISDVFISSAAVCDFKPLKFSKEKIKKINYKTLKLKPTEDILGYCGKNKKENQILIGFALETYKEKSFDFALEKLVNKNLDLIILNYPDSFESNYITPTFIFKDGSIKRYKRIKKYVFEKILFSLVEKMMKNKNEK